MNRILTIVAAAATLTGAAAVGALAAPPPPMGPGMGPAASEQMMPAYERSAHAAQMRVNSDARLRMELAQAVRSDNQAQARKLLVEAGFSAEQARSAKLMLVNHAPGGGELMKVKVKVSVKCCPPEIIITIEF